MTISVFDLFTIGIGPSSSHTVGPMRAANQFVALLKQQQYLELVDRISVELYGSLALTGKGHGTDGAVLNGLAGELPETVTPENVTKLIKEVMSTGTLQLPARAPISFSFNDDLIFHYDKLLPKHSNGMRFSAYHQKKTLLSEIYYSIGGGFIISEGSNQAQSNAKEPPFPFTTSKQLLDYCVEEKCSIAKLMLENEKTWRSEEQIIEGLHNIYQAMRLCIKRGSETSGFLPGRLQVKRRAAELCQKLKSSNAPMPRPEVQQDMMNWLNLYAMAVNEENAAGGRVVTAPTNGAAGIIPAVLAYHMDYDPQASNDHIVEFLLTAGAIAILYKKGASISGAEVGCQGEVGVASSMAAGALAAVLGGTLAQIENAAEIAMEHHLGMTCDPVGGLVQIPCIERNAMGAVKAVNAARLALMEDGKHKKVSLDKVIITMRETGRDMMTRYKETSQGGLAVNVTEC